jgi:hypothetical protein
MNKQERMDNSIWETYRMVGAVLVEKSALPRVEKDEDDEDEESVNTGSGWTYDQDDVRSMKRRRKEFADHLKNIRKGKAKPEQKEHDWSKPRKEGYAGETEHQPPRSGPGGTRPFGGRGKTHAQRAADIKSDMMSSRGDEHESHVRDAESKISNAEKQAVSSRKQAPARKAAEEKRKAERKK